MKNKNDYGFYSGGYIFDRLDRAALSVIHRQFPATKSKQLYTTFSVINYYKQLCSKKHTIITCDINCRGHKTYYVAVKMLDENKVEIARAEFNFKIAKHNYCETKEN